MGDVTIASDVIWAACVLACCGVFGFLGARAVAVLAHAVERRTTEGQIEVRLVGAIAELEKRLCEVEDERDALASRLVDVERDTGHLKSALANRPASVKRATAREVFG